jgi:aspartate aminotransferase-like enzyme
VTAVLFGPGLCPTSPSVLRAQAREPIDPTGPEFSALMVEIADGIRRLCAAPGHRVIIQATTASGALEGALLNLTRTGDRVVAVVNGQLSARLAAIAERVGLDVARLELPWGTALTDVGPLRELVDDRTRLVLGVHLETSTGAVTEPALLVEAARRSAALVLVDVVSSIGALPIRCAEWGVDVLVSSSQKGLGGTPGLGVSVVSPRAMHRVAEQGPRTYALDWTAFAAGFDKGRPGSVFTPAVSLVFGLAAAVGELSAQDPEVRAKRLAEVRRYLSDSLVSRGFTIAAPGGDRAENPVVVAWPPAHVSVQALASALAEGLVSVGHGQGPWKGRVVRFGVCGQTFASVDRLIAELDEILGTGQGEPDTDD